MKPKITPRANQITTRIFYAALAGSVCLALPVGSFAKKGGNGGGSGGGGGEEPSGPVEVPAPLSYRVTWFDAEDLGFAGPLANYRIFDVNCYGQAVGWVTRPNGVNIAVLASAIDSSILDLNAVFAPELSSHHPGWRLNSARQINAVGQIGMTMVPDEYPTESQSPTDKIVVGDLETGVIHVLGTFENAYPNDLTELGDVSVGGRIQAGAAWQQRIYSPYVTADGTQYAELELASDALNALNLTSISRFFNDTGGSADEVYLNNSLVLSFAAVASETRSSDPFCFDLQNDVVPRNVGDVGRYYDQLSLGLRHFSISQRAELIDDPAVSLDHGFICGESEGGGGGFILTPLVQP